MSFAGVGKCGTPLVVANYAPGSLCFDLDLVHVHDDDIENENDLDHIPEKWSSLQEFTSTIDQTQ